MLPIKKTNFIKTITTVTNVCASDYSVYLTTEKKEPYLIDLF